MNILWPQWKALFNVTQYFISLDTYAFLSLKNRE